VLEPDRPKQVVKSRLTLLFLILIFAMPPLLGWIFYLNPDWLPDRPGNSGTLIQPPRPLHDVSLYTPEGIPFDWHSLDGFWTLTIIGAGSCSDACLDRLIQIRQSRLALGVDRQRIARLLILLPHPDGQPAEIPSLTGIDGTLVLTADGRQAGPLKSIFDLQQPSPENILFLIDPMGALMMRYDTTAVQPKDVVKDLELLLNASANWRTPTGQ
jgi:cytochrome oxidase Cu insertion factor (SCO1/SenC/PrrC family)